MPKSARITLTEGPLSHTHLNRKFERGKAQIVSNPAEIAYYRSQPGFTVKMLKDPTKTKKASAAKKKKTKVYKKAELQVKSKKDLVKAAGKLEILLTGEETKKDLIEAIMEAQSLG